MSDNLAIIEKIGEEALWVQLAEEASELSQAALKVARIMHGTNPTPITINDAFSMVQEEYTDVVQCAIYLNVVPNYTQMAAKEKRFIDRLSAQDNQTNKTYNKKEKRYG